LDNGGMLMASRMKAEVIEVFGTKKDFEYELDMKIKELTRFTFWSATVDQCYYYGRRDRPWTTN